MDKFGKINEKTPSEWKEKFTNGDNKTTTTETVAITVEETLVEGTELLKKKKKKVKVEEVEVEAEAEIEQEEAEEKPKKKKKKAVTTENGDH